MGAFVVLVVVGAGWEAWRIVGDLDAGRSRLDRLDLDTIRQVGLDESLSAAADDLSSAAARAESARFLGLLGNLPVLDDQVDAVRDLTAAADELGGEARTTGERLGEALDRAGSEPSARVDLLDLVASELDRIEDVAATVDVGAEGSLLGPLASARADVVANLDELPARFDPLREQVAALRALLAGPTDYLVTVGNNAEMRTGAGMPLSAGLASFTDGDIALGDFKSTVNELYEPTPTGRFNANPPAQLLRTYPRWNLGRDFPETAVIPRFPVTAPMYADLAADTQGWEVEGVVHIDAMALAALLEVTGPVEIDGVEYSSETAPQLVLNQPYLDFDEVAEREQRLEAQSDLAGALFEAIQSRSIDPLAIIAALQEAASGRHVMVWSRDPVLQDTFVDLGIVGDVGPFDTMVSFLNTAANKLDWYIRPTVEVETRPLETREWEVTLTATIENPAGIRTSRYVDGFDIPELTNGTHRTLLLVHLPSVATAIEMPGSDVTERGVDGQNEVIGTRFTIPRGETREVVVRFRLPEAINGVAVQPSARAFPVPWIVEGRTVDDDAPFVATFGAFPDPGLRARRVLAGVAALVAIAGAGLGAWTGRRSLLVAGPIDARTRLDATTAAGMVAVALALAAISVVL